MSGAEERAAAELLRLRLEHGRQHALTLALGQQCCPDGDHENVLPCPHCGAAL